MRVGYFDDSLPYVFFNVRGELVGFDVEMALQLARDLGVDAEFVPVGRTMLDEGLDPALCDIVMSGVAITADRASSVQFSDVVSRRDGRVHRARPPRRRVLRMVAASARWATCGSACRERRTSSRRSATS